MPNNSPKPLVVSRDNAKILDTLKGLASNEYQARIPDATQAGIKKTVDAIWQFSTTRNEAIDALVNFVGLQIFRSNSWQNPLKWAKKGYFEYGLHVQETKVGLLKAQVYDANRDVLEDVLFGTHRTEVESFFHTRNRQSRYDLTIEQAAIKSAFYEQGGLNSFITELMASPGNSDEWDEFLLMTNLFRLYYDAGGFFKIHIDDLSDLDADSSTAQDSARRALRAIRAIAAKLPFYSRSYNAAHMYSAANPDEMHLFVTPEAQAAFDVDALAGAFNIDRAEVPFRVHVIPAERFNIPGCQAILTTENFFQVYDTLFDTQQQPNGAHLTMNYFLHHWQVISASLFEPAIMFWTGESDEVTEIFDPVSSVQAPVVLDQEGNTVTDVVRGNVYQVNSLAVTTPVGGVNDAVILSFETAPTSNWTFLNQNGTFVIGINEGSDDETTVDTLTIVATSVDDPTKTASTTVNVVGDYARLWDNPAVASDSDDDGLFERVPEVPDFTDNVITIPSVTGVVYSNGATALANGSTVNVANGTPVTITAAARSGNEIATGAPTSWTFTYVAPAA